MDTRIAYFDETGDDGNNTKSSDTFVLTSMCMSTSSWQDNFEIMKSLKGELRTAFGFPFSVEIHTRYLVTDKNPYHSYGWSPDIKRKILSSITEAIISMDISVVNVIIDKAKIHSDDYPVLKHALTYNIQRIENSSRGDWNYLIITDPGRTAPMRKMAREVRAYNPIPSIHGGYRNLPVKYLIEDILEKDSKESFFIQVCDFISYFVSVYYKINYMNKPITGRASKVISDKTVLWIMEKLDENNIFNTRASHEKYGLVIYPK